MVEAIAPRDQYQALVDENGRVTLEWYSWFIEITKKLNELETRLEALEP